MPRIQPLEPANADPSAQAIFEDFRRSRGNVPNMFRTMALRPEIMATAAAHMDAVFSSGTVDRRLKELVTVRVSQINCCDY